MSSILITGGAGFIGSHFVDTALSDEGGWDEVFVVDSLSYAGNLDNLSHASNHPKYSFIHGDICSPELMKDLVKKSNVIVNFAAESHVDRSISNSDEFMRTNILGTQNILESIRSQNPKSRFVQISTDEVYGSLTSGSANENSSLNPASPYAASKASADLLVNSYKKTYGLNVLITRTCNNFGPRQYPEKLIPLLISKLQLDSDLPIYGDGTNRREWIYVKDNARIINSLIKLWPEQPVINIGSGIEFNNLQITEILKSYFPASTSSIKFVEDRLGHDYRYSVDYSLLQSIIPEFKMTHFDEGMESTIAWYKANSNVEKAKSSN